MLELNKRDAELIENAIRSWQQESLISEEQGRSLKQSIKVVSADWQSLSLYIFIGAVSCALMSFGALILDEKWIEILKRKLSLTDGVIAGLFLLLSAFLCYQGWKRNKQQSFYSFNRELFWLLPVLSIGVFVVYAGKSVGYFDKNYGLFWLLATFCYGITGIVFRSRLLWLATLLSLIPSYVKLSTWISHDEHLFLGMNLPCRMVLLAALIILLGWVLRRQRVYQPIADMTWNGGWLLFLVSGWLISIFGNCGTWEEWQQLRQVHLLQWVVWYTIQCIAVLLLGSRLKDEFLRDLGMLFLLLDLYTRYFEYLWDFTNKGLFFGVLALLGWWTGKLVERRMRKRS
ncbi:hypothetical protein SAMN05660909_01648 [Chitinophaga terrae (ex Kim and Jung 2007)]|uniref:DUF2157 domain-containing protein n=1 Tax=Chitinophaga terrae (ex Kim and Jung 2007) TaxID=408074 RepID=A0A1H4AMH0_9BACT|nr:hypothetical protein [Chitinophaga terrae (ex Kim and Jung 2007)]MDQ0106638.1 hypothetical protein [Chitinophaga terrae (ex Kim and Jung 2007)]GEP89264.1 hypothetical protein CTE07_09090 [Chitinophaga terrae (ex Kim and Jung 2007)]SEA36884.1 hypothetical protein SAMN05660909_01648 [Chitinophaga terrae (ex Kim and Jung 2007)]